MAEDLMLVSAQINAAYKESRLVIVVTTIFPAGGMEGFLNIFIIGRWAGKDLIREM